MTAQEIRDLFKRHNVPLSKDDVWEVRPGSPVVKHPPLERLAAVIGVEWGPPQILRSERDEAVLIATGKIGDGQPEWSIGEAVVGQNYKVSGKMAAYPWAMAEKRAKDRVILKLAGLHGAYSEEEADDFKHGAKPEEEEPHTGHTYKTNTEPRPNLPPPNMQAQQAIQAIRQQAVPPTRDSRSVYVENSLNLIGQIQTPEAVSAWLDTEVEKGVWKQYGITEHQDDGKAILMACKKRRLELRNAA
jgi:hypothetical protein